MVQLEIGAVAKDEEDVKEKFQTTSAEEERSDETVEMIARDDVGPIEDEGGG